MEPMKLGEIRMGDFNAHHSDWDDQVTKENINGTKLYEWSRNQGCTERSQPGPTHDYGYKIDLIFPKDQYPTVMKIMHNGRVEQSDHTCQSVIIPLMIPPKHENTKTDYSKVDANGLINQIKDMKLEECHTPKDLI